MKKGNSRMNLVVLDWNLRYRYIVILLFFVFIDLRERKRERGELHMSFLTLSTEKDPKSHTSVSL